MVSKVKMQNESNYETLWFLYRLNDPHDFYVYNSQELAENALMSCGEPCGEGWKVTSCTVLHGGSDYEKTPTVWIIYDKNNSGHYQDICHTEQGAQRWRCWESRLAIKEKTIYTC